MKAGEDWWSRMATPAPLTGKVITVPGIPGHFIQVTSKHTVIYFVIDKLSLCWEGQN